MDAHNNKNELFFEQQDPEFYAGAELHRIKQQKMQRVLERRGSMR